MNYHEILSTVEHSDEESDWVSVDRGLGRDSRVYVGDPNLRIETSIDDEHVQNENFTAAWANRNPDPSAKGYYYDLYYNSTLIKRFVLVSVDGARALLPPPGVGTTVVSKINYKVAQLFDSGDLNDYFNTAGLSVA